MAAKSNASKKKLTEQTLEDPIVSVDFKDSSKKKVEDLEVKDAQLIFHSIWHELEQEVGVENLHFPAVRCSGKWVRLSPESRDPVWR